MMTMTATATPTTTSLDTIMTLNTGGVNWRVYVVLAKRTGVCVCASVCAHVLPARVVVCKRTTTTHTHTSGRAHAQTLLYMQSHNDCACFIGKHDVDDGGEGGGGRDDGRQSVARGAKAGGCVWVCSARPCLLHGTMAQAFLCRRDSVTLCTC